MIGDSHIPAESSDNGARGRYLLFVWTPAGYQLEEREGSPPAPGTEVDVVNGRQRVTKIAPSPLPGDQRPCAYLIA